MRPPLLRFPILLVGAATLVALPAAAQEKAPEAPKCDCGSLPRAMRTFSFRTRDENRAALGLSTTSGSMRDTLGLLVTDVTSGGPAEKAGIEEGDRLQAVNGVDLRVAPADAGDREIHGLMSHRLIRTLTKVKPGDPVELRVYSDGKVRTVKVVTGKASELFRDDGVLHLGADWLDGSGGDLEIIHNHMRHLRHQMDGLRYKVEAPNFEFDLPDESITPPPMPTAPSAPRHFMRIRVPRAAVAPTAPVPPVPPVPPVAPTPARSTVTI